MAKVTEIGVQLGIGPTCAALGLSRATYYRSLRPKGAPRPRPSPRALTAGEKAAVLEVLHEPRFVDLAPAEVQASLLDEQRYLCSVRTMYRILAENEEVRERRDQLRHPAYTVPELLATRPNELWSWDITKLLGPVKWTYYYLYTILDVFSRFAVGWMVAYRESARLAERLIQETCRRQGIQPGELTIHADRGSSMTSKPVALLLADLGVTKTHSRPHVSNDNPYSEAQFKTLKYRPDFPDRFGSLEHARAHCGDFYGWYNYEHHHAGLGYLRPCEVHWSLVAEVIAQRASVLAEAYARHPERFPHGVPRPASPPKEVWINKPKTTAPTASGDPVSGAVVETDAHRCSRTNDRDPARDRTTPLIPGSEPVLVAQ